jgi:acyl-CoA reductase-like NAD-dependent aldehyde dehydrogenase
MTYIEKIIDVTTGEETIRPYTAKEIAEVEKAIAEAEAKEQAQAAKAHERSALLAKLGITEEEAALLLS